VSSEQQYCLPGHVFNRAGFTVPSGGAAAPDFWTAG
jgi:hypothetical protein